jgi:hypothetical protein
MESNSCNVLRWIRRGWWTSSVILRLSSPVRHSTRLQRQGLTARASRQREEDSASSPPRCARLPGSSRGGNLFKSFVLPPLPALLLPPTSGLDSSSFPKSSRVLHMTSRTSAWHLLFSALCRVQSFWAGYKHALGDVLTRLF